MERDQMNWCWLCFGWANAFACLVLASSAFAKEASTDGIPRQKAATFILTKEVEPESESKILEQINQYQQEALEQITNVNQLSDVQPQDWAYEALRSLVERYGLITGYPDGTFRGNNTLSRYEFAAALQRTLDLLESLISQNRGLVTPEDIVALNRLKDQFVLELSLLRGDVDAVTARTAELELTQFSTTTKLQGEVLWGLTSIVAGDNAQGNQADGITTFGHRTRLNLETSFTGRDLLLTRLEAEGLSSLEERTLTPEGELAFTGDGSSNVEIDALLYNLPVSRNTEIVIAANGGKAEEFADTLNPYFDGDGANGAISRFATRPSIYYLVEGAGVGLKHSFNDELEVSIGYLAGDTGNPQPGSGLFDGSYGALAQVVFQANERTKVGLTYVNAYNKYLQTGSSSANLLELPTVSNSFGLQASYQLNSQLVLGGWLGYTDARVISEGNASIWNWAVTLAFPDLGKTGNLGGIILGMEPKVTSSDGSLQSLGIEDESTSLHLEAFYQHKLTDNIAITPGVIWLTAPDHDRDNNSLLIGTVRTKFSF